MNYKHFLFLLLFLGCQSIGIAQSKFGLEGQVCLTTDAKSLFLNFGGVGPTVKLKQFDISLNMLPSLWFNNEKTATLYGSTSKLVIRPVLGLAPQLIYKKFIISAPMYYLPNQSKWTYTFGLGYKLLKF